MKNLKGITVLEKDEMRLIEGGDTRARKIAYNAIWTFMPDEF